VLDTSVLLSDPHAIFRFAEHAVVLPVVVISELEAKRHDPEIGYFARQALRNLDELRLKHERLDFPISVGSGGSLRVELNHSNMSVLPSGLQLGDNDSRILAVALNLVERRVGCHGGLQRPPAPGEGGVDRAGCRGVQGRAGTRNPDGRGWRRSISAPTRWRSCTTTRSSAPGSSGDLPVNTGLVIHSDRGSALGRVSDRGQIRLVRGDRDIFGLHGRSAEQRLAIDLLLDPELGIVSLGGSAGTGKSALALCAGLDAVLERQQHRKIMVFRPLYAVGGQELGYLPGDAGEKMNPWAQAVFDTLGSVVSQNVLDEVIDRGLLEVLPLTHIRGRSLHDAFVIVDEAQSLERNVLLTVLSRIGQNSRVVLTHDVAQRDNLRVGRHDGVASVIETLKGHSLFGHITLTRSERSAIAALVTEMLESNELA
jgi:PhoH-like ATPase